MTEHEVGDAAEIADGESTIVEIDGRELGVFNIRGDYYALPNSCPHQYGPVCEGQTGGTVIADERTEYKRAWEFDEEIVFCPWHDLEFHIPSGNCLALDEIELPSYEITVRDGRLFVDL